MHVPDRLALASGPCCFDRTISQSFQRNHAVPRVGWRPDGSRLPDSEHRAPPCREQTATRRPRQTNTAGERYLNVSGADDLFEACRLCFASLFTDHGTEYRVNNGFDHFQAAFSVGVMKIICYDKAASWAFFTLDTETGFRDVVFITGAYVLGDNDIQATVDPDDFSCITIPLSEVAGRFCEQCEPSSQVRTIAVVREAEAAVPKAA
jgi:hypothetical protein